MLENSLIILEALSHFVEGARVAEELLLLSQILGLLGLEGGNLFLVGLPLHLQVSDFLHG